MKKSFGKLLLIPLMSLTLLSCGKTDKTYELQPKDAEVADKHAAVSVLGKAMKASASSNAISYKIESTKDLNVNVVEDIHNSLENTDSKKTFGIVANTISADYRTTTEDEASKDNRQSSFDLTLGQLHYETSSPSSSISKNRSNVKFSSYIKDKTYYIDPTNKELIVTVTDLADYFGIGDYRTLISSVMKFKYYATSDYVESILDKTGRKDEIEAWIDTFSSISITDKIDEAIVELDGKVDNWDWLASYVDENGDYTLYASMNKDEFAAFMDEMDPIEEGEERQTYAEALTDADFTSLEFSITFDETGLKGVGTVFDLTIDKKNVDVYENTTLPFPGTDGIDTRKKVGYENINYKLSGGFKVSFGTEAPKDPGDKSNWTDIEGTISKYFK